MEHKPLAISRLQPNYEAWLKMVNPDWPLENFDGRDPADFTRHAQKYAGLVLTGGGDIHPSKYGSADKEDLCRNMDSCRDELEFRMTETALHLGLPVMGICRGLQVLNVWLGGTLIPDIPSATGVLIHKGETDTRHSVVVTGGTLLADISGTQQGMVNSSHHQAINQVGRGLQVSAKSDDGLIEAVELSGRGVFCLAVQWHPERMDFASVFSGAIARVFLEAAAAVGSR